MDAHYDTERRNSSAAQDSSTTRARTQHAPSTATHLTVGLGNTLNLILLLDGIAVGGALGSIDELISEALSNCLDVAEGSLAGSGGQQPDGLVHTAQGRDIHGLAAHHTSTTNTGGILAGAAVDDGINSHLQGILVGEEVHDLKRVLHNAGGHHLLAIVAAVHHERACEPLDDGALGLAEPLLLVPAGSVWDKHSTLGLDSDVVLKRDILHLNLLI
mmetsp:Transcript_23924/g.66408  ORF Transcript_23924/g.66408 Transcript_23924/m.66408 type:complete len:216 (+) Transcript_23924:160-807(+)